MDRRAMLMAGAAVALGTGCASRPKEFGAVYYQETVQSLAATPDWRGLIVFGSFHDYELMPPKALVELLTSPLRSRLAGDFRDGHLLEDNTVRLNVRLTLPESGLSAEEASLYRSTSPQLPGHRVLFDQRLKFRRYPRAEIDRSQLGLRPTNQPYVIDIVGDAVPPPTSSLSARLIDRTPTAVLIPIAIVLVLMTQKGMPLK
ncbi:hypothetical protein [Mitsuaria sp. GD03876]|uniref:hypothetical protein n=1 Tax=Mitsuaria sp. GD03876 TaxID=2975399 RepID=UPI00244D35C3|nr:hypothetical protein [Mitsuaria sp. GD03876]MDH0865853.1 hypothetical protein [Mitsuaria sp. GD03876]